MRLCPWKGGLVLGPLPLALELDQESQGRRSQADFELGRLREAVINLRDPMDVLVRPTRESEVVNVMSLRGLVLTRRELMSGQHELDLPYDLERYKQIMEDVAGEPMGTPVSVVVKKVARGLAGMGAETLADENLPWRASDWSFAKLLGPDPDPDVRSIVDPDRAQLLFSWMDDIRMPIVDTVAVGMRKLIELDPFTNTLDVLHVYGGQALITAERLQVQVLPFSEFFVRNRSRFRDAYQHLTRTGDYNEWFRFVADCIIEQSAKQVDLAHELSRLPDELERKMGPIERRDGYFRLIRVLSRFQFVNAQLVATCCGLTTKRARELLHKAEEAGIVTQAGEGRRNRNYEVVEVRQLIRRYAGFVRDIDANALRDPD